jgi:hypothetical protein
MRRQSHSSVFRKVGGLHPGRSVFDLSYEKKFDCDMGQLIPVLCEEMVPGDKFQIGNEIVIRFNPLVAPVLHEINVYVHYFFVPTRIIDENWEEFITGGPEGENDYALPRFKWYMTTPGEPTVSGYKYKLWDYFGFPVHSYTIPDVNDKDVWPLDYPWRVYNMVWNEYYRDENLQGEVELTNNEVLNRAWEKDYFTSALPWQQRGTAPALPLSGLLSAEFLGPYSIQSSGSNPWNYGMDEGLPIPRLYSQSNQDPPPLKKWLDMNKINMSEAITFDVNDLRTVVQVQKWLERNARAGVRYTEFLRAHFGVTPRDDRLQRPEYIGGSKSPVIVSEVLQTSATGVSGSATPQANLAGHGISANRTFCGSYFAMEFGYVIGLMSVMPRTAYQDGIERQWLRRTRYDFYFAEFAHLGEQAIENQELVWRSNVNNNKAIFG